MEWGDNVYTVLPLPADVSEALAAEGAKRVEGELGEYPVNLALTKAPVIEGTFLYTGKALLKEAGLAPGETIEVRLRAADPDFVEVPSDVSAALRAADRWALWNSLSPGKRRGLLHPLTTAKRPETRQKRIGALLKELQDSGK
ncbi:MAG: YdeI/OmpD-associated family protein [Pseudomonadota bacterium]